MVQMKENIRTINGTVTTARHKELLSRDMNKNVKTTTSRSDLTACFRFSSKYSAFEKGTLSPNTFRNKRGLCNHETQLQVQPKKKKKTRKKQQKRRVRAASGILRRRTRDYIQAAANSSSILTTRNRSGSSCGQKDIKPQNRYGKKKKRDLSLHAIANDDAYSLSLDMHPSPAVSGERQGQGEKKEKADSIAVGKCLSSFKFKQPKMVGVDRG